MTPTTAPSRGKPQTYPWQKWIPSSLLSGKTQRKTLSIQRGRDFRCQPHGMAQMFRNRISRLGYPLVLSIEIQGDTLNVTMEKR